MEKSKLYDIYKTLHKDMDQPGYRPLIRSASAIFNAPVVFTDDQYQLIAIYPEEKIGDFVYDTLLEQGYLSDETIADFHNAYLRDPGKRYEPFYEKSGLVEDCPRIFAEVYDDTNILGHAAIFLKDKPLESWQLEAASILTDILRIKINLSRQIPTSHADTLHYLLSRKTTSQAKTRAIAQIAPTKPEDALLLVAPLDQTKSQHAFAALAMNYCLHQFPNAIPTVFDDDLVVLFIAKEHAGTLKDQAMSFSNYLKQHHILSGAVHPVEDLYALANDYFLGRLTALYRYREEIRHNNLNTDLFYYHDITPYPLLLYLSQQEDIRCFNHPAIEKIQAYDQKNSTDYYQTLACYCRHFFQKNETAQSLHIHRNTLNYRIDRIQELFHLNLQDNRTLLHLIISLEMMTYD